MARFCRGRRRPHRRRPPLPRRSLSSARSPARARQMRVKRVRGLELLACSCLLGHPFSGSQRRASQIRENEESGGSIARRVLAEYRVQAVLTQVRLANMPGEGPTLGSNRYSPEQGELVEQRASAVSDTGERIVTNRDREVSLLV